MMLTCRADGCDGVQESSFWDKKEDESCVETKTAGQCEGSSTGTVSQVSFSQVFCEFQCVSVITTGVVFSLMPWLHLK